jgi:hypothetical protein
MKVFLLPFPGGACRENKCMRMPTEIADRSGEQLRLCLRGRGKRLYTRGLKTLYCTEVVGTISRSRGYKGVIRRRDAKGCRVYGLEESIITPFSLSLSLSLCNETASPVVVVSCYSSTLSDVTDVA